MNYNLIIALVMAACAIVAIWQHQRIWQARGRAVGQLNNDGELIAFLHSEIRSLIKATPQTKRDPRTGRWTKISDDVFNDGVVTYHGREATFRRRLSAKLEELKDRDQAYYEREIRDFRRRRKAAA